MSKDAASSSTPDTREGAQGREELIAARRKGRRHKAVKLATSAVVVIALILGLFNDALGFKSIVVGWFSEGNSTPGTGGPESSTARPNPSKSPQANAGRASWNGPHLLESEVPAVLLREWQRAKNRHACTPLALPPTRFGDGADAQVIHRATFIGGWGIIYKHPRGDFTIAGTGEPAHGGVDPADPWPYHIHWNDGSVAGYGTEGGQYSDGPDAANYLAYLIIPGQDCLYNIRTKQGKWHLEYLLDHLKLVNVSE
jgi:hypothetical protein